MTKVNDDFGGTFNMCLTDNVHFKDGELEGYLNGQKYLEWDDATFSGAGGVGLWTKADAVTYLDDLGGGRTTRLI